MLPSENLGVFISKEQAMKKQQNNRPRPLITLTAVFFAGIVVVLLGAVSAVFGLGSAAFTGKFGSLQITTTSVGIVLVIAGMIFLYKLATLIPHNLLVTVGDPKGKVKGVDIKELDTKEMTRIIEAQSTNQAPPITDHE
jgi:hypothetical protein